MEPSQSPQELTIDTLREAPENPRFISDQNFKGLGQSMQEFGDLSCFVRNRRTGNLVGGHQRSKVAKAFDGAKIILEREWPEPTAVGTVAVGKVIIFGEPFGYREVDWDQEREDAANIAANSGQGQFDQDKLAAKVAALSTNARKLTTLSADKTNELLRRAGAKGGTARPKIRKYSADEIRPFVREFYVEDEDAAAICMKLLDFIAESDPLS